MATIGLIIDVVIIALLVIFGILGYKKGFLKSFISLFSWVVCIIIAILTAKYVASWINGIYDFSDLIGDKIAKGLVKNNEFYGTAISTYGSTDNMIKAIPGGTNKLLVQLIKIVFSHSNVNWASEATVADVMGSNIGDICMLIIAGILVFTVLMIVIKLLSKFLDKIASTKILGGLNKILGLTLGLIKAACIILIFNGIIGLSLVPAANKVITPLVQDNTHIERVIYNETDKVVEKYLIKGDLIQNWVNDLWKTENN